MKVTGIVFFLLVPILLGFSQPSQLTFNRMGVNDGLSQNSVNCIMQDRNGFMWFGTQDGLNRFDGYEFKIFRHQPGNPNTITNNYIWCLYEDSEGLIWIGTFGGGLSSYDPSTHRFTHYKKKDGDNNSLSDNRVTSIVEYPAGTLWVGTDDGLNKFDKESGMFTRFLNKGGSTDSKTLYRVSFINHLPDGELWMVSDSGLISFNTSNGLTRTYTSSPFNPDISLSGLLSIFKEGDAMLASCNNGVVEIDFNNKQSRLIFSKDSSVNKLSSFSQVSLAYPGTGKYYWLATGKGIVLLDKFNGRASLFGTNESNDKILSHNNIISIYENNAGIVWIGTRNGLNRVDKVKNNFETIKFISGDNQSYLNVSALTSARDNKLWIGFSNGISLYDNSSGQYQTFTKNNSLLSSNYILSILNDSRGDIWIGTRAGGLSKVRDGSDKIENVPATPATVHAIYEDKQGKIWLGTALEGLVMFDPGNDSLKRYPHNLDGSGPSHPFVFSILEDSKGNFWVGTANGGLNLFDRESGEFIYIRNEEDNPKSLSNEMVLCIHEDTNERLWVGTAGRLNKLDIPLEENMFTKIRSGKISPGFTSYGIQEGLPNEVIYGILDDGNGNFWISTNNGIVNFDPVTDKVLKTYTAEDGLQGNEFNQNSFYRDEKGFMYFGGVAGLSVFHPDSIRGNVLPPPVAITRFSVFNEEVPVNSDEEYSLDKDVMFTDEIDLEYDQDVISFDFAALNYASPEKNEYAYMMEGFDNDWIYAGDRRSATYTNLDPGSYTFKVKASNNDGIWNEEGTSVILNIPPPPWLSWYAYTAYALLFIAGVFLFVRVRVAAARREIEQKAKIEMAKIEERENVRKKSSADFHDEAGNKITKISLLTELAKREVNGKEDLKEYLDKIEENTKELSTGMRDFIWVLDPAKDSLWDTINRIEDFGLSMFEYTETNFTVKGLTGSHKNMQLSMDYRRAMVLIFKEAINNIAKYAAAENVTLELNTYADKIKLVLTDDGRGFDPGSIGGGYGLSNMKERAGKIGGELKIESGISKGTRIIFSSKITHKNNSQNSSYE